MDDDGNPGNSGKFDKNPKNGRKSGSENQYPKNSTDLCLRDFRTNHYIFRFSSIELHIDLWSVYLQRLVSLWEKRMPLHGLSTSSLRPWSSKKLHVMVLQSQMHLLPAKVTSG